VEVPEYSIVFTQLMLINSLINALAGPFGMAALAYGNIKAYQLVISSIVFSALPLAFLLLYLGLSPFHVLALKIVLGVICFSWQLIFVKIKIYLSLKDFLIEVILPVLIISFLSILITLFFQRFFIDWLKLIITCIVSTLSIGSLVYFLGLKTEEKILLRKKLKDIFKANKEQART
jgi:hypothetical protein